MPKNDSGERHANARKTIIDSDERHVAGNETIDPNAALRAVAAQFMRTMAARFTETCRKFGISEEIAGALLTKTLLLDEPTNAEAFEVAWSDEHDAIIARTEKEHGVQIEADCYYVEVLETATGGSVFCEWGDSLADDGSDQ